jgi:hypothetical protein
MTAQCSTCFFDRTTTPDGVARLCRHDAPSPSNPAAVQPRATWPAVLDTDWCGDGIDGSTGKTFSLGDSSGTTPPGFA